MEKFLILFLVSLTAGQGALAQITKPIVVQKPLTAPKIDAQILTRERIQAPVLSQADKLKVANEMLKEKGMATANSLELPVKLSTVNPKAGEQNYLSYFKPWNVLVIGNAVQFSEAASPLESSLAISFKPAAPGNYLFSLSVKKVDDTEFRVLALDGISQQTLKYANSPNKFTHITFLINFPDDKQRLIFVYADRSWSFFDAEISRVK